MNAKHDEPERIDIEDLAERAERGEDISAHFSQTYSAKQRVNIDFPLALLREIDAACQRIGVTRQAWVKMVCAEYLHQHAHYSSGAQGVADPSRSSPG